MRIKKLRLLLWCAGIAFALFAFAVLGASAFVEARGKARVVSPEAAADFGADCILVLGAGLLSDGSPSPMLADRVDTALALWQAGAADKLLMSGDHGRVEYDEVAAMKQRAVEAGVPSEDVFKDHAGFSTYESLYRARDVFQAERVVIVTQEYHLYRALYIAERLGLEAVGVSADRRTYAGQTYRDLREILARDKDFLQCLFQPKPTFLGEAIPVWGNGDATA